MNYSPNFIAFREAAQNCAMQMMLNADYMRRELTSIDLAKYYREAIIELCDEWLSTKHDVFSMMFDMEEFIAEDGETDAEVMTRSHSIMVWLNHGIFSANDVVEKLQDPSDERASEHGCRLATMLVMESAMNVLGAHSTACEAYNQFSP